MSILKNCDIKKYQESCEDCGFCQADALKDKLCKAIADKEFAERKLERAEKEFARLRKIDDAIFEKLLAQNTELRELLRLAVGEISVSATCKNCLYQLICNSKTHLGAAICTNWEWQHADKLEELRGGKVDEM